MGEYIMWLIIFAIAIICTIFALIFLWKHIGKFWIIQNLAGDNKLKKRLITLVPMLGLGLFLVFDMTPAIVCIAHLVVFWIITELVSRPFRIKTKYYIQGVVALLITGIYLSYAWYQARNVVETHYTLESDKVDEPFRVVMFSDSHIGTTFNGKKLGEYIIDMGKLNPDIVVIVGDYVDDASTREDMIDATQAFGKISPVHGIYYVQGNHDRGYYNNRNFTFEELCDELIKNGVIILDDESVDISESITLIGRSDKSEQDRMKMADFELDKDRYNIVLNHQPNDQMEEKKAGADLVLSGHTHGGQLIPITYVGEWIGANDQTKGIKVDGESTFIVSDGISDWEIPFKTGCKAEYLVIDVK